MFLLGDLLIFNLSFLLIVFQAGGSSKVMSGKVFVTIYKLSSHTFPGIVVKCLVINSSMILAADITGKETDHRSISTISPKLVCYSPLPLVN